ncbi:hypothetical protein LCGC14_1376680 [marine sediment metagenome]|uniref:Phage late control D family protein n=1 Tax=marine sediment metagenome TaxID=412755 RepID=A0A0F9MJ86_9ZZZZ
MVGLPNLSGADTGANILTPVFQVRVGAAGTDKLSDDIAKLVTRLEYDSADGMADAAKLDILNPDFAIADLRIFQPGNEIAIAFGYGTDIQHVGRVMIRRVRYNFPQDGSPAFTVEGYTRDSLMMDDSPEKGADRIFANEKLSGVVRKVAGRGKYGFSLDVDDTPDTAGERAQIGGISDYQVVKGCANLSGFFFWVDGDADGTWRLHFKSPAKVFDSAQQPDLIFNYNQGDDGILLSFQPEVLIQGAKTKLKVIFKDPQTSKIIEEDIDEGTEADDVLAVPSQTEKVEEEHKAGTSIKIVAKDFSFEIESKKRFKTAAEAKQWAAQWFRRHREGFITGKGVLMGTASLRARQIHTLKGLSKTLDGKWYFSRVRHIFSNTDGYRTEFDARKQDSVE